MTTATTARSASPRPRLADLATALRRESGLFLLGVIVIALHVLDDSFLQPSPGTSAGDHLVSGLVPLAVLAVRLPAADVDANVHPTKALVRFRHARLVQEMIIAALHEALRRPSVVPSGSPALDGAMPAMSWEPAPGGMVAEQSALFAAPPTPATAGLFGRVLGQVQDTFIISTSEDEVFFLDQHVMHERILFERLRADLNAGPAPAQALLFPETLDLPPGARVLLDRWRAPLERLGFDFDLHAGAVLVRAVPTLLKGDEPRRLLEAAVDELGGPKAGEPALDRALAFVACRAAIKADTPLAREEMERIVSELGGTQTPYFCPHGRPTVSRVSLTDIRKELRRTW
jgi:DNA mismatch repair protein MutL